MLLEVQLGVLVDLVRRIDQQVGPPVDLGAHPGLEHLDVHRPSLGSGRARTVRVSDGSARSCPAARPAQAGEGVGVVVERDDLVDLHREAPVDQAVTSANSS